MQERIRSFVSGTRRDFLKGGLTRPNQHIASVLVQAWPEKIPEIESHLTKIPGVESHGSSTRGKLILSIESENDAGLVDAISKIEATDGVITASLVYHHMEEIDDER